MKRVRPTSLVKFADNSYVASYELLPRYVINSVARHVTARLVSIEIS